jgi:hypothetical protein
MLAKVSSLGHHISHRNLRELADKGLSAIARMQKIRDRASEQMGHVVQTLEVSTSAFAFGFARGAWAQPGQDVAVMGVPIDLAAGLAGHALALFGGLGRYADDTHNLSDGALASYATALGLKMGVDYSQKHPSNAAAHGTGWGFGAFGPAYTAGGVSDAELAGIVHRATR